MTVGEMMGKVETGLWLVAICVLAGCAASGASPRELPVREAVTLATGVPPTRAPLPTVVPTERKAHRKKNDPIPLSRIVRILLFRRSLVTITTLRS